MARDEGNAGALLTDASKARNIEKARKQLDRLLQQVIVAGYSGEAALKFTVRNGGICQMRLATDEVVAT